MTVTTSPAGSAPPAQAPQLPEQGGLQQLPVPPSDAEKVMYADRNLALIIRTSIASFGALLISQARFIELSPPLLLLAPLIAFTVVYYVISLVVNIGTRGFDLKAHQRLVRAWKPGDYPTLDIFLPVCGEPIEILRNTWAHVVELVRAYPGEATAYVLDDAASAQAGALAEDLGLQYLVRPNMGWMKKAGNLRHGFSQSSGEFILILDADFAPRADLPAEILPYFSADKSLGIVQSPQFFQTRGRMSWIERGAGAVQELFYRLVQVSRDRHEGAICVGTCAVYRRTALASNGGTSLIEHSEDVHTGFDLRRSGWGLRYVPVPLAMGLCPPDPDSFLTQQYRWCAGSMSLLGSRKFWSTRMRLRTRLCYLSGFCYYVHTALFTFATPIIPLVMLICLPSSVRLINYVFILPSLVYTIAVFPSWHHCRFGPTALMAKLLYGWAHVFALWDIGRRKRVGWEPTGGSARKSKTRRIWTGIALWNGSTSTVWVLLALWRTLKDNRSFVVLLFMGLMTMTITGMALLSRRNYELTRRGQELHLGHELMRWLRLLGAVAVGGASIAAVVAFGVHAEESGSIQALPASPHGYLGVYVPGMPGSAAGLTAFGAETHTRPNVAVYYSGWLEQFQTHFALAVTADGAVPLVQIDPKGTSLAAIAHGRYDSYLTSYAQAVRSLGHPVIISFGHEMNGDWYSWGNGKTSPADFVAAWRHIVNVFHAWGAFNVTWLWTINSLAGGPGQAATPQAWWPGASYVNWVGIDGYYYYQSESFAAVFGSTISVIRHFTNDPVLITETGIAPTAGKATVIPRIFAGALSAKVLGVVYFDADGYRDWSLEGDPAALSAFGEAAHGFG